MFRFIGFRIVFDRICVLILEFFFSMIMLRFVFNCFRWIVVDRLVGFVLMMIMLYFIVLCLIFVIWFIFCVVRVIMFCCC